MQVRSRQRRDVKVERLARHPLLAGCPPSEVARIARFCEEVEVPPGHTLTHQGWSASWLFLVTQGVAEVRRNGHRNQLLWPGQHFGELEVLARRPYTATVWARTPMTLLILNGAYLTVLADSLPEFRRTVRRRVWAARSSPQSAHLATAIIARWEQASARRRAVRRRRLHVAALVLIALAGTVVAAAQYHPPAAVMVPGPTVDITHDALVSGVATTVPTGRYLLISIRYDRPSLLGLVAASLRDDREIVGLDRVAPANTNPELAHRGGRRRFERSRRTAAAAAAQAAGFDVHLTGTGARVTDVTPGPAWSVLRPGDVIVGVDGRPLRIAADLDTSLRATPPSALVTLTVERDNQRMDVVLPRVALAPDGAPLVVDLETRDARFRLPFQVRFEDRDLTGESAGLAYALAVYDLLTAADEAHGRTIAATGAVTPEGAVRAVGGLVEKAEAARAGGARLLLVPLAQAADARGRGLDVRGVRRLSEAIAALR